MFSICEFYSFRLYHVLFTYRCNSRFLKEVRILTITTILLLLASTSSLTKLLLVAISLVKSLNSFIEGLSINYRLSSNGINSCASSISRSEFSRFDSI